MKHSKKYADYMQSAHWRNLRNRVLWRDQWVCQECFARKATEGHHLSYGWIEGRGYSLAFEVISLCHWCHMDIHNRPYKKPKPETNGRLYRSLCPKDKRRPASRRPMPYRFHTQEGDYTPRITRFGANVQYKNLGDLQWRQMKSW